ncbi:MAG: hypothetical protein K0R76_680 [Alphaproteobacteria bacterium]|nr:hypothetical protein [Alphaproteobacteria bacterium]
MLWHKILPLLMPVSLACATPSPSSRDVSQKAVQQKLVKIAATIQNYEAQLSAVEHDLNQARAEESAILRELDHHNQRLMETIHYLRHATQYSPLLAMLSAPKPEDVIHTSLLLRSITPEIHRRNQQLLEKVKALSHIRAQLETRQNQLRDITFHYHEERNNLDALLKNHSPTVYAIGENPENNLNTFTLIPPVTGKLIPTYKDPRPEWASFTQGVIFSTRPGAHVISPLSGTIAFAGDYAKGQEKMVIVEAPNSHIVISGLGSLNCKAGQSIIAGEPIGRMPPKPPLKAGMPEQNTQRLYLEVWCQEQTIDPRTVLKEKRKEP